MSGSPLGPITCAVSWGPDRIDLTIADDRSLVYRSFDGRSWSEPKSLGGRLASAPAATAWNVDELEVFAIFDDGRCGTATGTAPRGTTGSRWAAS